jgi:NAD(P)-dependent dehydrogenase (short-subunit alcohol dehydrogenase family)/acyl carrier protein
MRLELTSEDADRDRLSSRLKEALADGASEVTGVLSLLASAESPHPGLPGLPEGLALNVAAVQALGDAGIDAPLWLVTSGAVSVSGVERLASPVQAQSWGLGRVAALEHPLRWGGLIDLPADPDAQTAARLTDVLALGGDEDQWAIRATGSYVARLTPYRRRSDETVREWSPSDTVLITGATGSLGPHVARWAAARGAGRIVLASRRGAASPGAMALLEELTALGVSASAESCDFGNRDEVASLIGRLAGTGHTVRTVFHAAAHLALGSLEETTLPEFARIVRAKVNGAANLAEFLDSEALQDFVLFSSVAGVWGSGEHAAYAAANAFLDAFAQQRRADGLPATSVAWGIWREQTTIERTDATRIVQRGLPFIAPELAFRELEQVLGDNETFLVVADVDWASFLPVFTSMRPSPLISEVPEVQAIAGQTAAVPEVNPEPDLRRRLASLTADERGDAILELVRAHAAAVLGHSSADHIGPERAFRDLGFDSVMSVGLRNRLNEVTGLALPPTMVFDHANPAELAEHLRYQLLDERAVTAESVISDIDRLEGDVVGLGADDTALLRLAERLGAMLMRVDQLRAPATETDSGLDVENASTEEILHFLDEEFGRRDA